jgi:hypothetical protein
MASVAVEQIFVVLVSTTYYVSSVFVKVEACDALVLRAR